MAAMWRGGGGAAGRVVDDYVSFIDLAPTFLEVAGLSAEDAGMEPVTGRSLVGILTAAEGGVVDASRDHVLIGKERHDIGRPHDVGYPIRGIFEGGWLYLRNFEPDRWPTCNPETGYLNCDGGPTKTEILKARKDPERRHFWETAFGKRPAEELYHVAEDPDCLRNLADDPAEAARKERMRARMERELKEQADPRMEGRGDVFDRYPLYQPRWTGYYERAIAERRAGETKVPGWVYPTDIEPLDEFPPEE